MWVSRYFIWFVIFGFMGWIWETTYCTLDRGSWRNRGFLFGPLIPIYGVGATAISAVVECLAGKGYTNLTWWQVFLIAFFGSMVLEYATHWGLEKMFHMVWWDYSKMPLNINGRICLPASTLFGLAGILVVFKLYPLVDRMTSWIPAIWMELLALIMMALLAADLTLTVNTITNFTKELMANHDKWNAHMTAFVESLELDEKKEEIEERVQREKERFSKEHVEASFARMNGLSKSALTRVKDFRPKQPEKSRDFLRYMKDYMNK